jgi:DNA polymerase-3 subunit epsilon
VVREVRDDAADGAAYLGPFGGRREAELAAEAILEAVPLRTCRTRLSARASASACALAEMGRCGAPCDGRQGPEEYAALADLARAAMRHDVRPVAEAVLARLDVLVADERFEQAAGWRDRLAAFVRGAARAQRLASLVVLEELVAARPTPEHGWEVHVVRRGRLVAAASVPPGLDPRPHAAAAVAAAEHLVDVPPVPMPAGGVEEAECVVRWLEQPGVRLGESSASWSSPANGAARLRDTLAAARESRAYDGERRGLRPVAQPAALLATRISLGPPAVEGAH